MKRSQSWHKLKWFKHGSNQSVLRYERESLQQNLKNIAGFCTAEISPVLTFIGSSLYFSQRSVLITGFHSLLTLLLVTLTHSKRLICMSRLNCVCEAVTLWSQSEIKIWRQKRIWLWTTACRTYRHTYSFITWSCHTDNLAYYHGLKLENMFIDIKLKWDKY